MSLMSIGHHHRLQKKIWWKIPYVHVHGINAEIVGRQVQTLKDLLQRQFFPVTEDHQILWRFSHLCLDESQQMLLIHTRAMMNVSIHLSHVVEITMGHPFDLGQLLILVQKDVHVPLALQIL